MYSPEGQDNFAIYYTSSQLINSIRNRLLWTHMEPDFFLNIEGEPHMFIGTGLVSDGHASCFSVFPFMR
jgi:hypothetical protein